MAVNEGLQVEVAVCEWLRLPHSVFATWSQAEQATAVAAWLEQRRG